MFSVTWSLYSACKTVSVSSVAQNDLNLSQVERVSGRTWVDSTRGINVFTSAASEHYLSFASPQTFWKCNTTELMFQTLAQSQTLPWPSWPCVPSYIQLHKPPAGLRICCTTPSWSGATPPGFDADVTISFLSSVTSWCWFTRLASSYTLVLQYKAVRGSLC